MSVDIEALARAQTELETDLAAAKADLAHELGVTEGELDAMIGEGGS